MRSFVRASAEIGATEDRGGKHCTVRLAGSEVAGLSLFLPTCVCISRGLRGSSPDFCVTYTRESVFVSQADILSQSSKI